MWDLVFPSGNPDIMQMYIDYSITSTNYGGIKKFFFNRSQLRYVGSLLIHLPIVGIVDL